MPIPLTVIPGIVANSATRLDAAAVNQAANPQVSLPETGGLTPGYLNIPALANVLADVLRGRNLIPRSSFAWEEWKVPAGAPAGVGINTENALEWWARPTGAAITVSRVEANPGTPIRNTWAAQLLGASGCSSVDYVTYVPPITGGTLREGDVTFSIYVRNPNGDAINVSPVLLPFDSPLSRANPGLTNLLTGTSVSVAAGAWARLSLTWDAEDYPLKNGFEVGIRTSDLISELTALQVTAAQLERASAASPYIPPIPAPDNTRNIPFLADSERVEGGHVLIVLGNGLLRRLPAPGPLLDPALLGWNRNVGIPEWQDPDGSTLVLTYTGGDQVVTVPEGVDGMEVHCWGAGGGIEEGRPGGVGGYSWGEFPVIAGQKFAAMVGGPGTFGVTAPATYGFGGGSDAVSCGGGGLTGLFNTDASISVGDTARAILIAGGGGGCSYDNFAPGTATAAGGNGNDPGSSGGMSGMAGHFASAQNSGGGGLVGGINNLGFAARGGTGYKNITDDGGSGARPIATAGSLDYTTRTTPVQPGQILTVPGSTSDYYQNQAGAPGRAGLMVIVWKPITP